MSKHAHRTLLVVLVVSLLAPALALGQSAAKRPPAAATDRAVVRSSASLEASTRILYEVSKLRGLSVLRPVSSGLKSRADIQALVLKDMSESSTPAKLADGTLMLRFLGLVPPDFELERTTVALLTEQIAGFYDPKSKFFYLADWIPIEEQQTVMAHELTHALTDQHFDLRRFDKWPDGDGDAELAAHALIEGDATALMIEYSLAERQIPHDLAALPISLTDMLRGSIDQPDAEHPVLSNAPDVMRQSLQFPYVYGVGFVQELLKKGSWPLVSAAYRKLPASTEQIMHPAKYLAGERPIHVDLPDIASSLGDGWRRVDADVNGEFGYFLILKAAIGEKDAERAADGWGGDRYGFYLDASRTKATLVHESVWDTPKEAIEFFDGYTRRIQHRFNVTAQGDVAPGVRQWETTEGTVRIERAGARVLVVEGYRGSEIAPVVGRLWGTSHTGN